MGQASEGRSLSDPGFSASGPSDGFGPEALLACYARGVFPMAESRDDPRVFIVEPDQRGVIPLDAFHIPSRLRRTVRGEPFDVRVDTAFEAVNPQAECKYMKMITPAAMLRCLREGRDEVFVDADVAEKARKSVERMIAIGNPGSGE